MKLAAFGKTSTPPQPPVSVDAIVAKIGGTADELVRRFGSQGDDWLGRPTIKFEDAQLAHAEWQRKQAVDVLLPVRYERYKEDRQYRLYELQEKATAEARASFEGRHDGGETLQRYLQVQWDAERAVVREFEANEPELTISQYREQEKTG